MITQPLLPGIKPPPFWKCFATCKNFVDDGTHGGPCHYPGGRCASLNTWGEIVDEHGLYELFCRDYERREK